MRVTSRTGSVQRFVENWKKVRELNTRRQMRRIDFWSSQTRSKLAPYGGCSRWGPNEYDSIEDCVSPPYVETFNSKLVKRFCTWTMSRYVFSNFEIPMFFMCSIVMNIICPFRTWLWNNLNAHVVPDLNQKSAARIGMPQLMADWWLYNEKKTTLFHFNKIFIYIIPLMPQSRPPPSNLSATT